jgi:glycosyltransferase involved in cell wall biosynthesis
LKVLFIIDSLQQGGAEQSLYHLIRHFPAPENVIVVYLYPKENLKSAFDSTGCKLICLQVNKKMKWIDGTQKLKKIVKQEQPNVMVSCLYESNIISRLVSKITNTPLIGSLVSDSYSEIRTAAFGMKRKIGGLFFYYLDYLTASIPKAWIANSESIKQSNAKKLNISLNKIQVVYRGRDVDEIKAWTRPENKEAFHFAFVGRLLETKGLDELVHAIAQLKDKGHHVKLDLYGDGPFANTLKKRVDHLGINAWVVFHGNTPNAWQKLYDSDAFVFPSWYEGFSGALVEAMMVGLPIVASNIPMNLEAVEHQKTAFIFRVKDKKELQQQMEFVINEREASENLGRNARRVAIERFNLKQISKQYFQLLEQILSDKN